MCVQSVKNNSCGLGTLRKFGIMRAMKLLNRFTHFRKLKFRKNYRVNIRAIICSSARGACQSSALNLGARWKKGTFFPSLSLYCALFFRILLVIFGIISESKRFRDLKSMGHFLFILQNF